MLHETKWSKAWHRLWSSELIDFRNGEVAAHWLFVPGATVVKSGIRKKKQAQRYVHEEWNE